MVFRLTHLIRHYTQYNHPVRSCFVERLHPTHRLTQSPPNADLMGVYTGKEKDRALTSSITPPIAYISLFIVGSDSPIISSFA